MLAEKATVQIFGRELELDIEGLTPLEASYLASFVEDRMREIQKQTGVVDTGKLAVLTALNMADELLRLRKQKESAAIPEHQLAPLIQLLDEALKK